MRIGMILDTIVGFPPDIRVEKEAKALSAAGHEVLLLTRRIPAGAPEEEMAEQIGLKIVRIDIPREENGKLSVVKRALTFQDERWEKALGSFVSKYHIQAIHVHDWFLVLTALRIAEPLGVPLVADLHEDLPAAMRSYRSSFGLWQYIVHALRWNYRWMRYKEARSLRRCNRIIVVVPEAVKRILAYGVPEERIVVVGNTEDETTFRYEPSEVDKGVARKYRDYWIASYVGGIQPHRGLDTALRAVSKVRAEIPNFLLLIVGAREMTKELVLREIKRTGVAEAVQVVDWQPSSKVLSYVMASDVCLIPHNDTEHTQMAIPHKLFQYMICAKPVLVSSCKPLARVVYSANCGNVFKASDSGSLAEQLIWMYQHRDELETLGKNGRAAALGPFAWKHDAARLVELYRSLEFETR